MQLIHGDCLDALRQLPNASVDSVVTDPPYGLSFMNKRWDYDVPSVEIWAECLRVLKPGGHLLAFAGTRTQHRMAVRIEDAGFEIRDMIAWVYGSGFPKSLDVSKAIDKAAGAEREVIGQAKGAGAKDPDSFGNGHKAEYDATLPATDAARQWQGWGTALKPALEPITVARKPLSGTVAANVLEHGTGALNIDGCRIAGEPTGERRNTVSLGSSSGGIYGAAGAFTTSGHDKGRWPANLIHDGSEKVLALFPETKGGVAVRRNSGGNTFGGDKPKPQMEDIGYGDSGSAARFFYCPKASKKDRGGDNNHPTVKPTDLMRYLCRLVTPPGGTVLDPFMGSGSTGKAAMLEGFRFIGIEREQEYIEIARSRIEGAEPEESDQLSMF